MAPRLPGKGKRPTLHIANSNGEARQPTIGDNSREIEEGERVQFISFLSRYSQADDMVEAAKVPFEAAKKARVQLGSLINAAGFKVADIKTRLKEMKMGTRDMAREVEKEARQRRWAGIVDADQQKLMLGNTAPEEAKDDAHWAGEGLKAGLRQLPSSPPKECGPRFHQTFMKAHERGLNEVLTANAPKPTQAEKAKADFEADNPDIDVDAAAKALKKSAFMNRDPVPEIVDEDPLGANTDEVV